jgi:hypothetical protein
MPRGYLEFSFTPTLNATIDESSLTDADPEFHLTGSAASGVTFDGSPSNWMTAPGDTHLLVNSPLERCSWCLATVRSQTPPEMRM